MLLTFDLNADLVLISPRDVADNTKVGSLVHNFNALYLQSPVTVDLKAVSVKIPLPILRPAGEKNWCSELFQALEYFPTSSHHLSSGTGDPKKRQSRKARLPSITLRYSFLEPKIRGVASGKKNIGQTFCILNCSRRKTPVLNRFWHLYLKLDWVLSQCGSQ